MKNNRENKARGFFGIVLAACVFCLVPLCVRASEVDPDILGVSTSYPPGAYVISQKDYDVFVRGALDMSSKSLERLGVSMEEIQYLMDSCPHANMIAFPAGETLEGE